MPDKIKKQGKIFYVVNTCDVWKSHPSMSFKAVCTTREHLHKVIRKLLKDTDIQLDADENIKDLPSWDSRTINDKFTNLFINAVVPNIIE